MGATYQSVQWNPQKRLYDLVAVGGLCLYLIGFITASLVLSANADPMIVTIRAFGSAAFILLHVVLSIGPLCRIRPGLLPLLYNRRHLGVITFLTGLTHAMLVTFYYHLGGPAHPILSIFLSSSFSGDLAWLPFQPFGFVALVILFLMAATSHDFWLNQLSAPVWKSLHMLVYVAYALLVVHVAFGILQSEQSPLFVWATAAGLTGLFSLHLVAGRREKNDDRPQSSSPDEEGFFEVARVDDIRMGRARIVSLAGERVAVFKYQDSESGTVQINAVSNVCRHQNGPLGEGKVVEGCITCPWHGYQYLPRNGCSPPPFTEKIPTFRVRLVGTRILVEGVPQPPGTDVAPAVHIP